MGKRNPKGTVYLLCWARTPLHHAKHYIGWTEDVAARLQAHKEGRGARLLEVIVAAGIEFELAQVWQGQTRAFERKLKNRHGASRFCPLCKALKTKKRKAS